MASGRYWKVKVINNVQGNNVIYINEIEFRGSIGGADLTQSIHAGTRPFGDNVMNTTSVAFDDNVNSMPCIMQPNGGVGWDFQSPVTVEEVVLDSVKSYTDAPGLCPTQIEIQYSNDSNTGPWTTWMTKTLTQWSTPNVLSPPDETAPSTTISPAPGSYLGAQAITFTPNEAAATYYTTDGSEPTTSSNRADLVPLTLSAFETTTVKYFSRDNAGNNEAVKTAVYTIIDPPLTVTVSIPGGKLSRSIKIWFLANETATIYYTLDGTEPTINSLVYSTPILISKTTQVQFFAKTAGGKTSQIYSELYAFNADQVPNLLAKVKPTFDTVAALNGGNADESLIMIDPTVAQINAIAAGTTVVLKGRLHPTAEWVTLETYSNLNTPALYYFSSKPVKQAKYFRTGTGEVKTFAQ